MVFFTSKAYLQATPFTEQVGTWSKTTNVTFSTSKAYLQATPLTEQVGVWSKTTNMAFLLANMFFSHDATDRAGEGYGAKPLTWHFLLNLHIFKRHHSQSRWGHGAKPLTWHFFTSKAYVQAIPLTEQVGDMEQNH